MVRLGNWSQLTLGIDVRGGADPIIGGHNN